MLRYSFPKLFVLACTSLLLVLAGCDQSAMKKESTGAEEAPEPTKQEKELNAALDAMAKDVAAALENRSVRTLVKKETGKLLAGQHNVLFQTIASKKVDGLAKNSEPATFEEILAGQRASLAKAGKALSRSEAAKRVREDAATIPKLDIGVPVNHEKWDPKTTTPLVAFHHRQEIDDTKLKRLKAYDAQGNVHWLDAQETPERPVVVVGVNERTTADGKVRSGYAGNKALSDPCLYAKCGGGGGGGSTEDSREYDDNEYLDRAKVKNDHEPWVKEDPEVNLRVHNDSGEKWWERSLDRDGGGMFSDDTSWNSYNDYAFKWTKSDIGSYTTWTFFERDSGATVTLTLSYKGQEFEVQWTDDSDKMGFQAVQFGTDDDTTFDMGDVEFETESKNP